MAATKIALHVLTAGMVLDANVLKTLTSKQIAEQIANVRSFPDKRLTVVDDCKAFFTSANMVTLIKAQDDAYLLVAEKAGVTLDSADIDAIQRAEALEKKIVGLLKPPTAPYAFAHVPANWTVEGRLRLTSGDRASVRRTINNEYSISLKQLQRIWGVASNRWAKLATLDRIVNVQASGYGHNGRVQDNQVVIGCQTIQRYELEQLALHLGWDFPVANA